MVTRIVDGDTIEVSLDGQTHIVRYIGIDTPEAYEDLYAQAAVMNYALVFNQQVILIKDVSETDRYGRLLRYVLVNDTFVNYEMVKQGYARAYTYPPDVACAEMFASAEQQARQAQMGLWAPTTWTFQEQNCDPSYPTVCIPVPPPDLDCRQIPHRNFLVLPPDPHRFDGDKDGVGCEK